MDYDVKKLIAILVKEKNISNNLNQWALLEQ